MKVQQITNQNNYRTQSLRFRGLPFGGQYVQTITGMTDSFAKSAEPPILVTIADIRNYLKQNADKILNGKIFNTPLTKDGDSLLMAFLHIKPLEEERDMYDSIVLQMSRLGDINYDQKDSMDITALEWVMKTENSDVLSLMKEQQLTQDPMLIYAYKSIKSPEFKKALLESGIYIPPVVETKEEQNIVV